MPVRKDYPIPECPSCRKSDSRVLNTFYTKDRQIVRLRECNFCSHRIYTQQHAESTIDISKTKIQIPPFTSGNKIVTLKPVTLDDVY